MANKIEKYISGFPENIQTLLYSVRETVLLSAPGAEEALAYGIPTFKVHGKNLVHFGGFAKHIGFYPTPSGIKKFRSELAKYETAKGSVKFPVNKPLPITLIRKIVKYRLAEVEKGIKKRAPK